MLKYLNTKQVNGTDQEGQFIWPAGMVELLAVICCGVLREPDL